MPNRTRDDLWERQKGESPQAYEAFVIYRDLGPERSITKVSQQLHKSRVLIGRWSREHNWVERCRAWDNKKDAEARSEALKKYKTMTTRHIGIALKLQEKAMNALELMEETDLSPKYVLAYLDKALEIEKLARREEAGIVDGGKADGQQDGESRSLADEIIDAYEARKRGEEAE